MPIPLGVRCAAAGEGPHEVASPLEGTARRVPVTVKGPARRQIFAVAVLMHFGWDLVPLISRGEERVQ